MALEGTWHAQGSGLFGREAKASIVRRIADEDDRAMAAPTGRGKRVTYECAADPAVAAIPGYGDRPQKQSALAGTAHDVPEPGGADDSFALRRDESKLVGRPPAGPQEL